MRMARNSRFMERVKQSLKPVAAGGFASKENMAPESRSLGPSAESSGYKSPRGGPIGPAGTGNDGTRMVTGSSRASHKIRPRGGKAASKVFNGRGMNY